jgi:predicted enzyme related to lactoylglutathione lyase
MFARRREHEPGDKATCGTTTGHDRVVDVLSSRILLRPVDRQRSQHFYRDILSLAIYREFGDPAEPGIVFYLGGGFLEVSGTAEEDTSAANLCLWLQVRDIAAEHRRLEQLGVSVVRAPLREPWGLLEMWIADPDGVRIVLVEIPGHHPLRRDTR